MDSFGNGWLTAFGCCRLFQSKAGCSGYKYTRADAGWDIRPFLMKQQLFDSEKEKDKGRNVNAI